MTKRVLDVSGALLALFAALPILLVVAVAIKLDSPGPVLFTQRRVGRGGRPFRLYKFRSMVVGSESGQAITAKADPRTTRVGRLIRPVRIDELPQLLNVLKGDMSLVGPRPESPEFVEAYTAEQRQVLALRPGITGPTQLMSLHESERFPPGVDHAEYYVRNMLPAKLRSDLRYVRTRTLARDLGYLSLTLVRLVKLALGRRKYGSEQRRRRREATRTGRPRLLFVTYTFPPARHAGTVRVWNIAKYLTRAGWTVTVVTLDPSLWRYTEHAEATEAELRRSGIRRLPTGHRLRWLAAESLKCSDRGLAWLVGGIGRQIARRLGLERSIGWLGAAERACSGLTRGDVDLILASGPPFSAFSLAQRLARRLRCPYVLDYRDLWSRNLYAPSRAVTKKEADVIADSAAVMTVSSAWSSVMASQFGLGPKLHVVSNGYDAEELAAVESHDFGHFAIVYAGGFVPPKRVVSPVMAALKRLDKSVQSGWKFHYYGKDARHVSEAAERYGLSHDVVVHGKVPRSQALSAVKGAGLAVVITSVEDGAKEDHGMITAKVFEAIGLGTPTLLIAPAASDANEVAEVAGLARSFNATDIGGIASFIRDVMDGHLPAPKDPAAYGWDNLIGGLDRVLRQVLVKSDAHERR
jgi:lipopolysaccharide/colanic/teichoic acid biosynthesis glycosyltransferase